MLMLSILAWNGRDPPCLTPRGSVGVGRGRRQEEALLALAVETAVRREDEGRTAAGLAGCACEAVGSVGSWKRFEKVLSSAQSSPQLESFTRQRRPPFAQVIVNFARVESPELSRGGRVPITEEAQEGGQPWPHAHQTQLPPHCMTRAA